MRQPDASIAGGAFDYRAVRRQLAALFGVADDCTRGSILHGAARIEKLRLAENLAAGFLAHAPQPDQRGVAN